MIQRLAKHIFEAVCGSDAEFLPSAPSQSDDDEEAEEVRLFVFPLPMTHVRR